MNRLFDFTSKNNIIQVSYNPSLGHDLGESYLSPDKRFSYVNIPKNGSSTLKILFKDWKFVNFQKVHEHPTDQFIVILRDPTDRWISAVAEYFIGNNSLLGTTNTALSDFEFNQFVKSNFFQNLLFDFVIFDSHTLPQCWFLQGLNLNNIKFFYLDQNIIEKITSYTNIDNHINESKNKSLTNSRKYIIIQHLSELVKNNAQLQKVVDIHYYADHKLFDLVKF